MSEYHGHMTLKDGSHVPLTANDAKELWESIEREKEQRAKDYPTEADCLREMVRIKARLGEFGWSDAIYCPKDGSVFDAIEFGSSGIHECHYEGKWPKGSWWIWDDNDMWPSRPVLYRRRDHKIPPPPEGG